MNLHGINEQFSVKLEEGYRAKSVRMGILHLACYV